MDTQIRPTFLTVLCILTFIGSGWTVISNTIGFATGSVYVQADTDLLQETRDQMEDDLEDEMEEEEAEKTLGLMDSIFGQVESIAKYKVELSINSLILGLVCLVGAVLMFRMQAKGYYLYAFGCALQVIVPILVAGFVPLLFYPTAIINGIFLVLYGTQLKHLR